MWSQALVLSLVAPFGLPIPARGTEKSSTGNICDDLQPLSRADEEVGGESWQLITAIHDEGDFPTLKGWCS
jgi:hypothetical protein